jgi:hypothetical protein
MCGRYSITLPPEAIREIFPNAWRAAELASMVQRGTDHCAARRAPSEGWWWSRASADDVGPDSATPSILT